MEALQGNSMDEVRRRLDIFFGHNHTMVERYLQLHGATINMRAIQEVRDELTITPSTDSPPSTEEPSVEMKGGIESPIFSVEVECPCCHTKNIPLRELRASSMAVKNDPFLAPVYFPMAKYQSLNYLTVNVCVCPRCFFASPDKKDFIQFNRTLRQNVPSQLSMGVISEIQDSLAARQELVEKSRLKPDFNQVPRPLPVAILSYQLADQRVRKEAESKQPYAIYKRAQYCTRLALLQRQAHLDDSAILQKALDLFKDAFFRTDFPNPNAEYQSCFLIFMLHLRFNQVKEAREYISVMEQSKKDLEARNAGAALASLNQWLNTAKARWDDRDNPRFWETPS